MSSDAHVLARRRPLALAARLPALRWSVEAWLSIGVTFCFLGITSWWLSQDRSIPIFDAGLHLSLAIDVYQQLALGHIQQALTLSVPYPPFAYLVGALGIAVGGIGVAQPIIAENLVFVPLLALGCYHIGRLAFGRCAGLIAVVVALGSPLMISQFHVFMTDAPETAMVAVAVWLILESQRFSRVWVSAAAGVAVGLGLLTKEPFAFFVGGLGLVVLVRGGWRNWRGLTIFVVVALAIALPWYIHYFSRVTELANSATVTGQKSIYSAVSPPPWSSQNLLWYFWNITNSQLYAPLYAFALIGGIATIVALVRRRSISPLSWELVVGALLAWFAITETFIHDVRYSMPLLVYLAVFASGWIARLRGARQAAAIGAVGTIALINTLGLSFGVGREMKIVLPGAEPQVMEAPGVIKLSATYGFIVGKPYYGGDVLGLMETLRRHGVRSIGWLNLGSKELSPSFTPVFSDAGLSAFAQIAQLKALGYSFSIQGMTERDAILGHGPIEAGSAPPCVRLSDGSGVWIRLGNPNATAAKDYCPYRHPSLYAG